MTHRAPRLAGLASALTVLALSTAATDPAELLQTLQDRMRQAEGDLALEAAGLGWHVVLDGPLNRIRSLHRLVTGYVKTHHRLLLPEAEHAAVPSLTLGGRTALYRRGIMAGGSLLIACAPTYASVGALAPVLLLLPGFPRPANRERQRPDRRRTAPKNRDANFYPADVYGTSNGIGDKPAAPHQPSRASGRFPHQPSRASGRF